MTEEGCIFTCSRCPKIFATRSNLKRHMENPNIHNIPYARSRDQKRWKGHSKKVSSKAETTERMRKWRAENRDKNKRNDLRCRVYRLARQKFSEEDSEEKQQFIHQEINKRLGRRMLFFEEEEEEGEEEEEEVVEEYTTAAAVQQQQPQLQPQLQPQAPLPSLEKEKVLIELPFYSAPLHKIELPLINMTRPPPVPSRPPSPISSSDCSTINSSSLPPMQSFLSPPSYHFQQE